MWGMAVARYQSPHDDEHELNFANSVDLFAYEAHAVGLQTMME